MAGVPFEMDGKAGLSARRIRRVLAKVSGRVSMDIIEIDERLTSVQAERTLLEANMRRKQRKQVIDQLAAALILQIHLDARRRE